MIQDAVRPAPPSGPALPPLADCHLHFEGSLPYEFVQALARRTGHSFSEPAGFETARDAVGDMGGFLRLFASVCRLFQGPEDYRDAARALAAALDDDGVAYAEIYVSPEIFGRMGLEPSACLEAIDEGLRGGRPTCHLLLDAVRQWGPESADRVLDLYEKTPLGSIRGFGMGGEERAVPASSFAGVYARARALGLKTSVHAGEWAGPASVREALDALRPDRVDHGVSAASDPGLLERLADERTVLCVAPTGNIRTGAASGWDEYPLKRLLDAGVRVALSADDPLLFGTTTRGEYAVAREKLGISPERLSQMAETAWTAAFLTSDERRRLRSSAPADT